MKIFIKTFIASLLFILHICVVQASFHSDFGVYNHNEEKIKQELIRTIEDNYGPHIYTHINQTGFLTADELEEKKIGRR